MAGSQRPVVPVADIVAIFIERYGFEYERPITNRWIGSILRKRLNIGTYKSHGVYVVPMGDRSKIELLCGRYGVSVIGSAPRRWYNGGIWGRGDFPRTSFPPNPYPSQANHYPLLPAALTRGGTSPRPLVPIFEPGTTSHRPAAAWRGAIQIFANLADPHTCLKRRTSHIMRRVFQHFVVGEHRP